MTAEDLLTYKTIAVAAVFAVLFAWERWRPAAPIRALLDAPRLIRNVGLWLVNTGASFLIIVPVTAWVAADPLWQRPAWWTGGPGLSGWGLALDLVIYDGLIYWWHRLNHRVGFLWRFHHVHHIEHTLDTTSAVRFHIGEVLLSATARLGVILALALPLSSVLVAETLLLVATLFHHSNIRILPAIERALSWVIVTPRIHWVHHHADVADLNANYANVLSVWDRIFGSRSPTKRRLDMPIGVPGRHDLDIIRLLAAPFRRRV